MSSIEFVIEDSRPDRVTMLVVVGIISIVIAIVGAKTLDSVGENQMSAMWNCKIAYTEIEHQRFCRNENDGFGHILDLNR